MRLGALGHLKNIIQSKYIVYIDSLLFIELQIYNASLFLN